MKTLVLTLLLVGAEAYASPANNYVNAAGTVVTREAEYISVVNSANAALTVGEGVCLDLSDDNGVSVDYCTITGMPMGLITDTSCAVGARCKVLKRGYFSAAVFEPALGAAVAGSAAFVNTTGALYGDTTDDNQHPIGVFLDASSTTGTIEVFVKP